MKIPAQPSPEKIKDKSEIKIKRFIECYVPVTACNLRCHYCYIAHTGQFSNKWKAMEYSADFIAKKALSVKRLGGVCMMNMCGGGETLIPNETIELARAFLEEGHFVTIVTNGTLTKQIAKIADFEPRLLERLFIKFSYQYLELKRLNIIETFFNNILKVKNAGVSIALEITPNDELIPYIEETKALALKYLKAMPHISIARDESKVDYPILTKLSKAKFIETWSSYDSEMLEFKLPVFGEKRKEFCYAGDWSFYVNLGTGDASQCYHGKLLGNLYSDTTKPINFCAVGNNCTQSHCHNSHSFLLWGVIPDFSKTTYADIRDRKCEDGSRWLNEKMHDFMSTKLSETNVEYTDKEKKKANKFSSSKNQRGIIKKLLKKLKEKFNI